MTRYIGIDYGTRRIGIAVGDDDLRIASPVSQITVCGHPEKDARAVMTVADEFEPDAFVLGLPKNMDGTEGKQVSITRKFGDALAKLTDKTIHYFDERLSSRAADELLRPAEFTSGKHKARRDAVAAQIILQGFLDTPIDGTS